MSLHQTPLFQRLLARTPLTERDLVILIATAPARYKDHYINKRNNRGKRLISQPTKEIKFLQKLLVEHELSFLPIHTAAIAYQKGLSIKDYAEPHATSRYLLKLDFNDFFLSLHSDALDHKLQQDTTFSKTERWLICNLLCRRPKKTSILRLSIGAPSSPFVSNYLMHEFDEKLSMFCSSNEIRYTRYADDLALSSSRPGILDEAKAYVINLLQELSYLRLSLNHEKTVNVSKKNKRTLTGLTLSNEGATSIGRDEKRKIRATFHAFTQGKLSIEEIVKLRGKLAFINAIDPAFVLALLQKYDISNLREVSPG